LILLGVARDAKCANEWGSRPGDRLSQALDNKESFP
jgi:hypothetical protein